jgi:hypothetical protein
MRITTAGNVGIGTTSPTGKLDILDTGSLNQLKVYSNNATPSVRTYSTSDGFGLLLNSYYSADGAGSFNRYCDIVASTGDTSSSAIRFFTKPPSGNPSERMRIESSGNLVYGSYHNSIEYSISLSIAATQWIKLCGINNPGQVVIKGHCGSNNSEESWEINVRETYTTTKTVISCQRQSYNPHIQEVRVEGSDGSERTIYIKIRAADFAPTCSWRILDCRGTPVIYNTNTTPAGAVYAAITVSGEKVYSTNEDITTAGNVGIGTSSPSDRLSIVSSTGGAGLYFVANKGVGASGSGALGLSYNTVNYTPGSASSNIYWDGNTGWFTLSTSSRKYKRNIVAVTDEQLDKALLLKPSYYQRNEHDYFEYGFIAEEVNEIGLDEFVTRVEGEISGLNYEKMVTLAIGLAQRQAKENTALVAQITALSQRLAALESK